MIAVFLSPLYFFGTWLLTFMFLRWLSVCSEKGRFKLFFRRKSVRLCMFVLTFFMSLMLPAGFLLKPCDIKYCFMHIGSAWMGVLMYSLFAACFYLLYCLIWKICHYFRRKHLTGNKQEEYAAGRPAGIAAAAGAAGLIAVAVICSLGIYNAGKIRTTDYYVELDKNSPLEKLDAVMIADIHLGYNIGCPEIREMVKRINECSPDIVFICGDIFDNDMDALDDPEELIRLFSSIETKYGVYACYGNHDISESVLAGFTFDYDGYKASAPEMDDFLKRAGIKLLMDEGVLIDGSFYVYGRPDYARPGRGISDRKTPDMIMDELKSRYPDKDYPIIVLDHEPKESRLLNLSGADLTLSGHTHDGQIFPADILVSMLYDNSYGYKDYGTMQEIVTSGVGLFGPYMRVGTIAEICNIHISFGNKK